MKIKSTLIAALIIFGAVATGTANDPKGPNGMAVVPVKGTKTYKVIFKGEENTRVKLNVYNQNSELIFTEAYNSKGFIRPLNFDGMKDGEYTVELIGADAKKVEKINLITEKSPSAFVHVSRLTGDESKYLLSVVNSKKTAEKITVKIFNGESLIHNEIKDLNGDFAQIYAVKVAGNIRFEVVNHDGSVTVARF